MTTYGGSDLHVPTAEASQDTKRYEATEHGINDIIRFLREIGKDVPIATE